MQSGYKISWTDQALSELETTFLYLEENWTEKEIKNLAVAIEHTLSLISTNPHLFPLSGKKKNIRRAIVKNHNTLYYRVESSKVSILSFFSNRQNPKKRKL